MKRKYVFQLTAQSRPVSVLARQDAEKLKMRQVIYHDRVAPFHTLARDFVIKLSGKPSYHGLTPEQVWPAAYFIPKNGTTKRLRQELGLKSKYAALVDLFDGKTYRLERLLQRLQGEVRNAHEKGWLENLCSILALSIRRHTWQRQRLTLFCRILLYPAVLCLGIGIFIGAIWANVSWGSYWAWDPKEVWALVTFMLYGMAFHVQSLPRFRNPYFFHWFLIVSFSAILMTYFGVNYVLGGMHSYAG